MSEDPAAELFNCELARSDRARHLARLADIDTDIQHARLLAERAHVDLSDAELDANDLERPSGRTFLLRVTGRRGSLLRDAGSRALVARIVRNQMRWLQGSYDRERRRLRDELDALPSQQELDAISEALKSKLGDPVPRALAAQIARAVERQTFVDAREALRGTRAAFDQAVDWLGRARRWTEESDGAFLADLAELTEREETPENTVRVAGSAAEASTARLRSQLGLLPGLRGDLLRTLGDAARDYGLGWARGMAHAILGDQTGLGASLESAGRIRQELDMLDGILKSRGAL